MRTPALRLVLTLAAIILAIPVSNGQLLKKLGQRAERAADRTVERRVDRETSKKTDQVLDSILEPGSKQKTPQVGDAPPPPPPPGNPSAGNPTNPNAPSTGVNPEEPTLQVYSKFDFVPGDKVIFFDDYSNDFIGDFPAKWNTNGSGEVVTIGDSPVKWMEILPGHSTFYIPDVPSLPEDFTIEFDLRALGIDRNTSSTATLEIGLSDSDKFNNGTNYFHAVLPFCQYAPVGIRVRNYANRGGGDINNNISADIREDVLGIPHISIAVNGRRFRLWVNEEKYVDIPRGIPEAGITTLKFQLRNFKDGKEQLFITNLKVAEGGVDLRRKLLSEGEISTNNILFDSGSAKLQPQSMGVIRQIYQVLQQDPNINLMIIGPTDADGDEAKNMQLSKDRAASVKSALINVYGASPDRLQTDGKGESQPVGDNSTAEGKAKNRRVVFKKI